MPRPGTPDRSRNQALGSFGSTLLLEQGATIAGAAVTVSLMSWMVLYALPLGGYVATRYNAANVVMVTGLGASVILGAMIAYAGMPMAMFVLLGITSALGAPAMIRGPAGSPSWRCTRSAAWSRRAKR